MEKDTEYKILKAAEEEFMEKGFSGARTTAIAERAGVTHAMLHYYFRTKEKLFERIVSEKMRLIGSIVLQSIDLDDMTIEEVIRNVVEQHLEFLSANPDLPRFLIGELYGASGRSELLKSKISRIASNVIERFQRKIDLEAEKGHCRKVEAPLLLLDIISLNVSPFLAAPLVDSIMGEGTVGSQSFIEMKKRRNYETIMSKLLP